MSENSKIEWTDHTFNPWIGCTKVSEGCRNCYAERDFDTRRKVVAWGPGKPRHRTTAAYWKQPLAWNRKAEQAGARPRVFCASLADWLDPEAPSGWLVDLLGLIELTPNLDWLLLTKRPQLWRRSVCGVRDACEKRSAFHLGSGYGIASQWIDNIPPENVWFGVTVEDQASADKRIPMLLEIPARVRFLSCEPLLGPVDLGLNFAKCDCGGPRWKSRWVKLHATVKPDFPVPGCWADAGIYRAHSNALGALSVETPGGLLGIRPSEFEALPAVDWVICGGESGPNARPMHPDWARGLRDQCVAAEAPFFFKQWGEWMAEEEAMNALGDNQEFTVYRATEEHGEVFYRVGKKAAGRLLDGRAWNEFPEVASHV